MTTEIAIVTGAGSGIGRAIALRLARDGTQVVVNDLKPRRAQDVAAEIAAGNGTASAFAGDVADEGEVAALVKHCRARFGDCSILVNNAGHAHHAAFADMATADFDRMFAVHVRGAFLCSRAVLPAMLAAGRGFIVNVASNLGQTGGAGMVHYSAAKAALIGMTRALAREVSAAGVRVNAVAPGPVNTPLLFDLPEAWRGSGATSLPLPRFGEPGEVAGAVAFLVSADAALFVGQTLGANSGAVML